MVVMSSMGRMNIHSDVMVTSTMYEYNTYKDNEISDQYLFYIYTKTCLTS